MLTRTGEAGGFGMSTCRPPTLVAAATVAVGPDKTATDNRVHRVKAEMIFSVGLVSNVHGSPPGALARAQIDRSQCHALGHEKRPAAG
eukprot:3480948-Prymnesium_polylepis.2